ncbi:MAG TPA: L,D-transpeptidase family protein [Afifellaceae bacterium]|nr:L,D-transpeptidase family protein [Afifellaceae bacterium]
MNRRAFLSGAAYLLAGVSAAAAQATGALPMFQLKQSEWADNFDSQSRAARPVTTSVPILSPQTVPAMEQAIFAYQGLAERGGWNTVPGGVELKIGMRHPNVMALRQRLVAGGDLRQIQPSDAFDSYVQSAVRRFQERHGIPADGVVGEGTLRALNVPAQHRLNQLVTNLERIKTMGTPADRYVMVNIPGAQIEAVEQGRIISRHVAVAGKVERQTPLLSSRIHEINFNPTWTVPQSLILAYLVPLMQKDPNYIRDNKYRIYTHSGQEIVPEQVNWYSDEAKNYLFRQDPGEQNALGFVKLNFYNPHAVFLHDTPAKNLFNSDSRFESAGCVRVHNVRELVAWVLRDSGYNLAMVDQMVRSGERVDVKVENPPAIYTVYFTAWTTGDGVVHFRNDIYDFDDLGPVALTQPVELIGSPMQQ